MNKLKLVIDDNGNECVVDEKGKRYIPEQTTKVVGEASGWLLYDESQGHCGLCGSLTCGRRCFK